MAVAGKATAAVNATAAKAITRLCMSNSCLT
jgi:hypothetical protein